MKFLERKKIDIVIFIEHKDRELQLSNYIKDKLEQENYSVIIASLIYHTHLILCQYEIKTIITPYIGFGKGSISDLFFKVHGLGINYININYEQFLFPFTGKFKIPKTVPAKKYQVNFAWGNHFKEYLTNSGASPENIYVTGRPYSQIIKNLNTKNDQIRLDLANEFNLNLNKKWVFIALTDGLAFLDDNKLNKIVEGGAEKEGMYFQVRHDRDSVTKLCEILSNLNKIDNHENFEFILRPHPSVASDKYLNIFSVNNLKIPQSLKIIKENSALNWLVASDVLITNYSTLIIDAYNINKKILVFNHDFKKFDYLWWVKFANNVFYKLFELNQFLNEVDVKLNIEVNHHYIKNIDSIKESSKIISLLTKSNVKYSKPSFLKIFYGPFREKRFWGIILRNFIVKYLNNSFGLIKEGIAVDYFKLNQDSGK